MDLHADPVALRRGADRLSALACELAELADRLDGRAVDGPGSRPGGLTDRCTALVAALRSDAAELAACEQLITQDRSAALAGEAAVLARMTDLDRRLSELSGRSR